MSVDQMFAQFKELYRQAADPEKSQGAEWKNVGGARMLIGDDGTILMGCEGVEGEDIDEIGEGESEESKDRRQAKQKQAELEGWEPGEQTDARPQWRLAKQHAPQGSLVFLQVGDTLYTFDEDAAIMKDVTQTGDGQSAAIKEEDLDHHLQKLLGRGHRVAVAENREDGADWTEPEELEEAHEEVQEGLEDDLADDFDFGANVQEPLQEEPEGPRQVPTTEQPARIDVQGPMDVGMRAGMWFFRRSQAGGWTAASPGLANVIEEELGLPGTEEPEEPEQQVERFPAPKPQVHSYPAPEGFQWGDWRKPRNRLDKAVQEAIGTNPQDQAGFKAIVEDVYNSRLASMLSEQQAKEDLIAQFIGVDTPARRAAFTRKLRAAEDTDKIRAFDEMLDMARSSYPDLLQPFDEATKNMPEEDVLFERLKLGKQKLPQPWDPAIIDEAFSLMDQAVGAGQVKPREDWEYEPFARSRHWSAVMRYSKRYHLSQCVTRAKARGDIEEVVKYGRLWAMVADDGWQLDVMMYGQGFLFDKEWKEEHHPRDEEGKFTEKEEEPQEKSEDVKPAFETAADENRWRNFQHSMRKTQDMAKDHGVTELPGELFPTVEEWSQLAPEEQARLHIALTAQRAEWVHASYEVRWKALSRQPAYKLSVRDYSYVRIRQAHERAQRDHQHMIQLKEALDSSENFEEDQAKALQDPVVQRLLKGSDTVTFDEARQIARRKYSDARYAMQHGMDSPEWQGHSTPKGFIYPADLWTAATVKAANAGKDVPIENLAAVYYDENLKPEIKEGVAKTAHYVMEAREDLKKDYLDSIAARTHFVMREHEADYEQVRERVAGWSAELPAEYHQLEEQLEQVLDQRRPLIDRMMELQEQYTDPDSGVYMFPREVLAEYDELTDQRRILGDQLANLQGRRQEIKDEAEYGYQDLMTPGASDSAVVLDWEMDPEQFSENGLAVRQGMEMVENLLGNAWGLLSIKVRSAAEDGRGKGMRAYASEGDIFLWGHEDKYTVAHELAHALDVHAGRRNVYSSKGFWRTRTKSDRIEHMGDSYDPDEVTDEDGWKSRYAGKYYYGKTSTEVFSMGVQMLLEDPRKLAQEDPEHFRYTLAALHGRFLEAEGVTEGVTGSPDRGDKGRTQGVLPS